MKRFDENDVAKRLHGQTPPPPPDLAARIKSDIPEHVEVPPALTAPRGTPPLIGWLPARHRVLALAATVLVAVTAVMVARRVLLPAAGPPLQVALIESAPAPEDVAVPATDAPSAAVPQELVAPAPVAEPSARPTAVPPRYEAGKGRRQAASDAAGPVPAPQTAVPEPAPQAVAEAIVAGVEGGESGGVAGGDPGSTPMEADEERGTTRPGFVEARTSPRFDVPAGKGGREAAVAAGASVADERLTARKAVVVAPAPGLEPSLAPAPTGAALLLLVPPGAVVTFEPTAVARYRPLPASGPGTAAVVEVIARDGLEESSPLLTVVVRPAEGPAPASAAALVLRRSDVAASFRGAPRPLRLAYLEARLADLTQATGGEAAILLAEAERLAAEEPGDGAGQALRSRWQAVAGTPPPQP